MLAQKNCFKGKSRWTLLLLLEFYSTGLILALKSSPGAYKPKIADAKYINEVTNSEQFRVEDWLLKLSKSLRDKNKGNYQQ